LQYRGGEGERVTLLKRPLFQEIKCAPGRQSLTTSATAHYCYGDEVKRAVTQEKTTLFDWGPREKLQTGEARTRAKFAEVGKKPKRKEVEGGTFGRANESLMAGKVKGQKTTYNPNCARLKVARRIC